MIIDKEQIKHIAKLAKIVLTEDELSKYEVEFNSILEYVSAINDCDVTGIEDEHNLKNYIGAKLYEDNVRQSSTSRNKILQNATENRTSAGYVKVKKKDSIID
jgi:aspartyl-tRNA(Asn)/glutamyl-tRNA(Gln) amidotransferase subunit C